MENQKESIICVTGRAQESVVPDIARLNVTIPESVTTLGEGVFMVSDSAGTR